MILNHESDQKISSHSIPQKHTFVNSFVDLRSEDPIENTTFFCLIEPKTRSRVMCS